MEGEERVHKSDLSEFAIANLVSKLRTTRTTLAEKQSNVEELAAELRAAREALSSKHAAATELAADLRVAREALSSKHAAATELAADLRVAREALSSKQAAATELAVELRETRDALMSARAAVGEHAASLRIARGDLRAKQQSLTQVRSRFESLRRVLDEQYVPATPYLPIYRQGLLSDLISRSGIDFSADCYLSLLPVTVPAALDLKEAHGGLVVCDCVESVEREKHTLPQQFHPPALTITNLTAYGALLTADKLLTVSDELAKTLERFSAELMVLPNYRNFEVPRSEGTLRKRCNLSSDDVLLIASGNVVIGFEPVLEALENLPSHVHLAAFVRLKPPTYKEQIEKIIRDRGLIDRVHIMPFVEYSELANNIADADIGLVIGDTSNPNWGVSLPNRLFDYLTGGVPVVAPPIPDVIQLIDKFGFGRYLSVTSSTEWEVAIRKVMNDLGRYRIAAQAARTALRWEINEEPLYEFLGRPATLTMISFRDLSRYQRFLRIAQTLSKKGVAIRAVFQSVSPAEVDIDNAEFYYFSALQGRSAELHPAPR